jgi:predicted transcriptional regulator
MAATNSVSSWSKKVGVTVSMMLQEQDLTYKHLAEEAAVTAATLKRELEGTKEFTIGDFVCVANAIGYTPGGLLTKCLK